jgi:hypothetical protein
MSGWPQYLVTGPVESVDPVSAYPGSSCGGVNDGIQLPAAGLDNRNRADVVIVAGHQHPVDSVGPGDDQALPENLGRVAAPPVPRKDAIAYVAAFSFEKVVESVADGGPADDLPGDVGYQERPGNPAMPQADTHPLLFQRLEVRIPRHSRLKAQAEAETLGPHHTAGCPERSLIIGPQWPEPEREGCSPATRQIADHRVTLAAALPGH